MTSGVRRAGSWVRGSRESASSRCSRRGERRPTSCSGWPTRSRTGPLAREMDMLLSTGERISCALCAIATHDMGHNAISLTGSQAGIVTDSSHSEGADPRRSRRPDPRGADGMIGSCWWPASRGSPATATTSPPSGRGGSDTTAVAIAAAIGAEVCEIYTDVRGVFQRRDPRLAPGRAPAADRLVRGDARDGGLRSEGAPAALGRIRAQARRPDPLAEAPFEEGTGTFVVSEDETMERPLITAVTHSEQEARVTLSGVRDEPGIAGRISGRSPTPT